MIDGQSAIDQPVKNDLRTYDHIQKIVVGWEDDYSTGCLLDYNYFNNYYKIIAIDLRKQQALTANTKAIQQIDFTRNLAQDGDTNTAMFFIIEEAKQTFLDFSQGTVK